MPFTPRKTIRLPLESYQVEGSIWHVVTNTRGNAPVFADSAYAEIAASELRSQVEFRDATLLLYCVMPDHVHAVIQIGTVDLVSVIRSYKAYVSRKCGEAGLNSGFWQDRFYDRGVRQDESLDPWITYVTLNPVKVGICEDWEEYPWIGGDLLDRP
jgi:REP element-mobilizing transposase RayT